MAIVCTFVASVALVGQRIAEEVRVHDLSAPAPALSAAGIHRLEAQRQKTVDSLLRVAQSPQDTPEADRRKLAAVRMLGRYRAYGACGFLVREIEYSSPWMDNRLHVLRDYPAARALVDIGSPSYHAILSRLSGAVSDRELRLFAFVVKLIDGKEIGLARLELSLRTERLEQRARNLSRLIELYKTIDFGDPREVPRPKLKAAGKKGD